MFKSVDAGDSWVAITEHAFPFTPVSDIVVLNQDPDVLIVATGYSDGFGYSSGIWRSPDAGSTWEHISNGLPISAPSIFNVYNLEVLQTNPNVAFIATSNGIYKTTNAQAPAAQVMWQLMFNPSGESFWKGLTFKNGSSSELFASGKDIYKTSDQGATWSSMTGAGTGLDFTDATWSGRAEVSRINIRTSPDPSLSNDLFAFINTGNNNGATQNFPAAGSYAARFEGSTGQWVEGGVVSTAQSTSPGWVAMAVYPEVATSNVVYYGGLRIKRSMNGGSSPYSSFSMKVHDDTQALEFSPNGNELWAGCHGGVFLCTNPTEASASNLNWIPKNNGLSTGLVYCMASSPTDRYGVMSGDQDNGVRRIDSNTGGNTNWRSLLIGDGSRVAYSADGRHAYGVDYRYTNVYKWLNYFGGAGEVFDLGSIGAWTGHPFRAIERDENDGKVYFGYSDTWKEADPDAPIGNMGSQQGRIRLTQWQSDDIDEYVNDCMRMQFRDVVIAPSDEDYIYMITPAKGNDSGCPTGPFPSNLIRSKIPAEIDQNGLYKLEGMPLPGEDIAATQLVVDPTNPNRIWVSCSGYRATEKVFFSAHRGNVGSWVNWDPNGTLPNLPVNDMVYQEGTEGGLYIAMDVGVYYRNNLTEDWIPFYMDLPNVQVYDLDINYCAGKIRAGTFGRGIWESDLAEQPTIEMLLEQDETWANHHNVAQTIRITTGHTLTVTSTINFAPGAGVVVEPGARLIVDGGLLTNSCGSFWPGIQAWGTTNQNQSGYPIPDHQAIVVLKNGAVIEHAREAIQAMNPNDWNMKGGVVQVQGTADQVGATFLNCRRAVSYVAYQNTNYNGQPTGNRSYFRRCDFIVDDQYRGGDDFYAHVSMWKVDGINFKGCHFKNLQTGITESDKLGQGIISSDAQFSVSGFCSSIQPYGVPCPAQNLTRSTFEGLDHGIEARISSTDRSFIVTDCDFMDNVLGVYSSAVNSFQVTKCNFTGGGRDVDAVLGTVDYAILSVGGHHGIYSTRGHGFRIEENTFARSVDAPNSFTGVRINTSGAYNSEVYKNSATGTNHGFVGEGKCIAENHAAYVGLQFLCNSNNNPDAQDIFDRKIENIQFSNFHSIRTQQGSSAVPAGNLFTQDLMPLDESDFKNNTDWVLNYWYNNANDPAAEPMDFTIGWVGKSFTDEVNTCPSRLDRTGRIHPYTQTGMDEVRAEFASAKTAYVNTAYVYNALLDGGNTDALIQEVQLTWPEDAWQLHDELMAKSPYLSTDVLREAVLKHIMPQAMLLEVLLANPDGTKKEGFVKWLQYEAPWPLPQYMIDLIVGSWEQKTFRTQLESDMGQHHADMSFAADELIGEWKNDSLGIRTDSILVRWQQVPSLGARYSEVLTRLERGEYDQAMDLMQGLEATYKLSDAQFKEREDALAYIDFLATAHGAGHDLMHLDGTELAALRNIAAEGCERPALWAQNILCFGYGECYAPCTGKGASQKMLRLPTPAAPPAAPNPLALYPNPATSYVTLAYTLADAPKDAILVLRGVDGRELRRMPLAAQQGQELLDTRGYAPGTYSVELLNDGVRIATERLVLKP